MDDYKKRMVIEYYQLRARLFKLAMIISACNRGDSGFELNCPIELLTRQLDVMKDYLDILYERMQIELTDDDFESDFFKMTMLAYYERWM